jgi:predicted metal-dependent HD superfamily phosphohydrolase
VSQLRHRFLALLQRLGATDDAGALADALFAAWSEPNRSYHDLRHLEDCLTQLDSVQEGLRARDVIEAALWFHDAVYDAVAMDNEERSARWAVEALSSAGVPRAVAGEVARLVLLTRHRIPPADEAGRVVCDIDLSVLGRSAEEFATYERRIRAEYAWVPEEAYREGRRRVLTEFLRRDPLFQTEAFRSKYEAPARANLARALAALGSAT